MYACEGCLPHISVFSIASSVKDSGFPFPFYHSAYICGEIPSLFGNYPQWHKCSQPLFPNHALLPDNRVWPHGVTLQLLAP